MTWEETIIQIRKNPDFRELVTAAYIDEDLNLNTSNFSQSEEFIEVLEILRKNAPKARTILDVGAGNGISTIAFAKKGFHVTALEPDPSTTIGTGAIRKLKDELHLSNVEIIQSTVENIVSDKQYDIIYARQSMHHADNLPLFLKNLYKHCKPGGLLITTRDHVVYNKKDKEDFLKHHPLHKFYGGENAYKLAEYQNAIILAGFSIKSILKHYDSVINYSPLTKKEFEDLPTVLSQNAARKLNNKLGFLAKSKVTMFLYRIIKKTYPSWINEVLVPGRLYSFIAHKK